MGGEVNVCVVFSGSLCDWSQYGDALIIKLEQTITDDDDSTTESKSILKCAYTLFIYEQHGYLANVKRIKLPH